VNFDPANMILYNQGNPIHAVKTLGAWIKHVHIKDANHTTQPGTWGEEVPWGDGEVGPGAFIGALEEIGFTGTLAIEREAGDDRFNDIKLAADRLSG
jgi:sugar phosphate isomerase/epimerase